MENEKWFDKEFSLALQDLDPEASVGFGPMAMYGCDVKTALKYDPITGYDPERVNILRHWVKLRLEQPEEADPILCFIKPEPHSDKKLREGRLRIISAVGFVDTMVDRVQFGWLHRAVMNSLGKTPVLVGWNPYKGGYRYLTARYCGRPALAVDKSGWDWTVQGWLLVVLRDLVRSLAIRAPEKWHDWVFRRWRQLFRNAILGTRDGLRVQQDGWGVMKSGCYLTLILNSVGQMLLHATASMRLGIPYDWPLFHCMGDDTLQQVVPDVEAYFAELRKLGAIVKEHKISSVLEFCGHEISGFTLKPVYRSKHAFKITQCSYDKLPELLAAFQLIYAHDPEMWEWVSKELAVIAPAYYRRWEESNAFIQG